MKKQILAAVNKKPHGGIAEDDIIGQSRGFRSPLSFALFALQKVRTSMSCNVKATMGVMVITLLALMSMAVLGQQSTKKDDTEIGPRIDKISQPPRKDDAVLRTLIVRKSSSGHSIEEWFAEFFKQRAYIVQQEGANANGYNAIVFTAFIDGTWVRGLFVEYGDTLIAQLSTELNKPVDDLASEAKEHFNDALMAPSTLATTACVQCVTYARGIVPTLSSGLFTLSDKKATMNSLFPRGNGLKTTDAVAVIDAGTAEGHVAVVTGVQVNSDGSLTITISEENWKGCNIIDTRTGTPEALRVLGYFDPAYPSGQSYPKIMSPSSASGVRGQQFWVSLSGIGFDATSMRGVLLGGTYCTTFTACQIPSDLIANKSSSSAKVPLTIGSPGTYRLYIFNSASGKTSNGIKININ
jgi:hypothetical protein